MRSVIPVSEFIKMSDSKRQKAMSVNHKTRAVIVGNAAKARKTFGAVVAILEAGSAHKIESEVRSRIVKNMRGGFF